MYWSSEIKKGNMYSTTFSDGRINIEDNMLGQTIINGKITDLYKDPRVVFNDGYNVIMGYSNKFLVLDAEEGDVLRSSLKMVDSDYSRCMKEMRRIAEKLRDEGYKDCNIGQVLLRCIELTEKNISSKNSFLGKSKLRSWIRRMKPEELIDNHNYSKIERWAEKQAKRILENSPIGNR